MCGILVTLEGERLVRVRGDAEHPLSEGYTCPKGRALPAFHHDPRRLDRPAIGGREVGWDTMLDDLAGRVQETLDSTGPNGVAMYLASGSTPRRRSTPRPSRWSPNSSADGRGSPRSGTRSVPRCWC
jgi:anaerobic selenocysteine-containing dehydrogenase